MEEAAFKNGDINIENYVENPRHIEVQVLADEHGHCIHLGECDCSILRRRQKIIEEAPSSELTLELRVLMGMAAIEVCERVGYSSVATLEFLLDEDGRFYFIGINTRI
ncbi:MAG: acetyl-CoA carboxylase, biotin carboxylase subunit [Acidobacteriota bacterium]|jgi:acetyl-CoA carboxylase biotin carboxylase subunit|nr:acetyl-CoA carboxylase, biotin carboxylase subunit [Acidobacteriota bacterium]